MIRAAKISEITDILTITKACAKKWQMLVFTNGTNNTPHKLYLKRLERNELFVLEKSSKIIGVIVISAVMDKEYDAVKWLSSKGKCCFIFIDLPYHPIFSPKDIAQQLRNFAENYAREKQFASCVRYF